MKIKQYNCAGCNFLCSFQCIKEKKDNFNPVYCILDANAEHKPMWLEANK